MKKVKPTAEQPPIIAAEDPKNTSSCLGALLRVIWIMAGLGALLFINVAIVVDRLPWFHPLDLAFFLTLVLTVLARLIDIKQFGGTTARGEKATMIDWRRYALLTTGIACGGWLAAHAINWIR